MKVLCIHDFEDYLKSSKLETSRQLLTNCIYLQDAALPSVALKSMVHLGQQPEFCGWGFNLDRGAPLLEKWNMIPSQTDIVMTHGPPLGHGDLCLGGLRAGCAELLKTIQVRVKPRFHIFGHIHEGYGVTSDGFTKFINASTCNLMYKATNPPIVFDFPIPNGHSKDEIQTIPSCNLGETYSV
ncbi:hypothetical protein C0Q70_13429 [Pomacea canaliculata]|uniref:Calcineurin-like phosphoesterase domain-containing protein n=1 Tax=Pomacea canaliculata TaxID=400727 RepID=A0A2T7NX86_POMCA|nr:hypothetical protein C0Q70_13429 [Pomacea canaliculata]